MKKALFIGSSLVACICQADTLSLSADTAYWLAGTQSNTSQAIQTAQVMTSASFEHFVPLVPNARLRYTTLNLPNANTYTPTLSPTHATTEAIAYYELLDTVLSLDVGVGVQRFYDSSQQKSDTFSPMVYTAVGTKLPLTQLSANTEFALAKAPRHQTTDMLAELNYTLYDSMLVNIDGKVGYRLMTIERPTHTTTTMQGAYVGIKAKF